MALDKLLKTHADKPFVYPKSAKSICGSEYIKGSVGGGSPKKAKAKTDGVSTVSITSITIR